MTCKLILNRGNEEQTREVENIENAFDAALPCIMEGYTARIADEHGIVKYTQVLTNGRIATYPGDAIATPPIVSRKPWWRFW